VRVIAIRAYCTRVEVPGGNVKPIRLLSVFSL